VQINELQGSPLHQGELSTDRNVDNGDREKRTTARVQGAAPDQRNHFRSHLQFDREPDALLLKDPAPYQSAAEQVMAKAPAPVPS
jgi:hypothetical protein